MVNQDEENLTVRKQIIFPFEAPSSHSERIRKGKFEIIYLRLMSNISID